MSEKSRDRLRYAAILSLILIISLFHYRTATNYRYLHEIYQRVYYLPILLAAFWYGPIGGLLAAAFTSSIYLFHIQRDWAHFPVYTFNQYAEILLYHIVAFVIGFLALKERRHREELERTSRELGRAYQQLQESFEHLKRADRLAALGQLSAGIAHEIRNPLGTIKGAIEIVAKELPQESGKREFVRIMKEEVSRLNALVTEFLNFARPPEPKLEPTAVNELIESTLLLVAEQARQDRVEIQKALDSSSPVVDVDPNQMRQVFLNVLLNGIEAMPEGGRLRVRSALDQQVVAVEISDEGAGMDDAALDRIFDPFFTTKPEGTGLGLSISFQLVERNGGRMMAHRNQDRGLTVRIELPVPPDGSAQ